jgi:hypothetical protein
MNTHTHTQSSWHLGKRGGNPAIYGKDGTEVAEILHGLTPEWRDNARLIASAPDLLAALKDAEALLFLLGKEHEETGGIDYNADFIAGTRNELLLSIAKAEGRDS